MVSQKKSFLVISQLNYPKNRRFFLSNQAKSRDMILVIGNTFFDDNDHGSRVNNVLVL